MTAFTQDLHTVRTTCPRTRYASEEAPHKAMRPDQRHLSYSQLKSYAASSNRHLFLVDLKTAAKRMDEGDLDHDQLALYAIAARKTGLLEQMGLPLMLRVDVILKTKVSEVIPITILPDRESETRVVAKARQIWKSMDAGVCFPNPGWRCQDCGYRRLCAKWPDIPGAGD